VLDIPATKPKFIERLKDDYIVREPKKEPSAPVKETPSPEPSVPVAVPAVDAAKPKPASAVKTTKKSQDKNQTELAFGPRI